VDDTATVLYQPIGNAPSLQHSDVLLDLPDQHKVEKSSETERSGSKHWSRNEDDDESLSRAGFDNLFAHVPTRLVGVPRNLDPCDEEPIESSARIGGGSVAGMDRRNSI
jgi:hypothetical protein